ncbi:MAG: tRNA (adenosine(37)-N6)-threonylcarbamoyltransferase complex dimerization subunit type 1 TsaB [Clostridia bacterium]|nr:tRNA (adenosine(37)-N6)-threonylcarbamoyltransferase complex dimerization subunit type 1 TsaB [Clostridia bacterium]MDE7328395.1 tRNA (adenosine(37)-N6)-threonylcarbamoyltransferase complex dimerization subunit type 1 TsaB [Clostridia bacterium]
MKILALDSTSENMVIALSIDNKIYSFIGEAESKKHNSQVLPQIDKLLSEAQIDIKDVDYFACVIGPGSFTGIRIGVSSVNALSFALGKKCVAITSFEELAYGVDADKFYCAIDCRHDCFYYAKFAESFKNQLESGEMTAASLKEKNNVVYKVGASRPEALIGIAKSKIAAGEFAELAPLYLKKSQAEREYDMKNMDKTV